METGMPRASKAKYMLKQRRQAERIEKGYEQRGVSEGEAEARAWATVNEMTGGAPPRRVRGASSPTNFSSRKHSTQRSS
jgi:plasmid stabilization system protein ParE